MPFWSLGEELFITLVVTDLVSYARPLGGLHRKHHRAGVKDTQKQKVQEMIFLKIL